MRLSSPPSGAWEKATSMIRRVCCSRWLGVPFPVPLLENPRFGRHARPQQEQIVLAGLLLGPLALPLVKPPVQRPDSVDARRHLQDHARQHVYAPHPEPPGRQFQAALDGVVPRVEVKFRRALEDLHLEWYHAVVEHLDPQHAAPEFKPAGPGRGRFADWQQRRRALIDQQELVVVGADLATNLPHNRLSSPNDPVQHRRPPRQPSWRGKPLWRPASAATAGSACPAALTARPAVAARSPRSPPRQAP